MTPELEQYIREQQAAGTEAKEIYAAVQQAGWAPEALSSVHALLFSPPAPSTNVEIQPQFLDRASQPNNKLEFKRGNILLITGMLVFAGLIVYLQFGLIPKLRQNAQATPTPSPSGSTSTPDQSTIFENSYFTLQYPQNWQSLDYQATVIVRNPGNVTSTNSPDPTSFVNLNQQIQGADFYLIHTQLSESASTNIAAQTAELAKILNNGIPPSQCSYQDFNSYCVTQTQAGREVNERSFNLVIQGNNGIYQLTFQGVSALEELSSGQKLIYDSFKLKK